MQLKYIFGIWISLFGASGEQANAADWLQFGYDPAHSSNNPDEAAISAANVATVEPLYSVPISATDGPAVFLAGVAAGSSTRDLLFITTVYGVTAFDAADGTVVWTQSQSSYEYSVGSSPAIDPGRQFVYGPGSDGLVHKLAVADGSETVDANWPARSSLKPAVEKSSAPLAIATAQDGSTYVYSVTSAFNETGDYQGHVTAIDLTTGSGKVFNAACSDLAVHFVENGTPGVDDCATQSNGIWGRGGTTYNPYNGRLYVSIGNGPFDANTGGYDWGDSVLALNPDGSGAGNGLPLDSYTPTEYQNLAMFNGDLGSSSPAMLPPVVGSNFAHLGIQLGKDGAVRLLDLDNLSGKGAPGNTGGELQKLALLPGGFGNFATPQPAVWTDVHGDNSVWVIASVQGVMSGLQLTVVNGQPLLESRWTTNSMSNSSSPLIANDVLYAVTSGSSGAMIKAFSPTTGDTLWTSPAIDGCCHAQSPIVVNGRVYLASGTSLNAFGLPEPPPTDVIFSNGFE